MGIDGNIWKADYAEQQANIKKEPKKLEEPLDVVGISDDGSFVYGKVIPPKTTD